MKFKRFVLFLVLDCILVVFIAFIIAFNSARNIKEDLAKAKEYLYEGDFTSAELLLNSSIVKHNNVKLKDMEHNIEEGYYPPVVDLKSGIYTERKKIKIKGLSKDSEIYYTLDGTKPDINGSRYRQEFLLPIGRTTLRVVQINDKSKISREISYSYDISIVKATVIFKDKSLEAIIRKLLNKDKGDIYNSDLYGIKELNITGNGLNVAFTWWRNDGRLEYKLKETDEYISEHGGISSLEDIGLFTNLTKLTIQDNQISDLTPLKGLDSITYLNFDGNNIKDISCLAEMKNLQNLSLGGNAIKDFTPLKALDEVKFIELNYSAITSLDFLKDNINLQVLQLNSNGISSIQPMSSMKKLTTLWINQNKLIDIDSLKDLNYLQNVDLSNNLIEDISALSTLSSIKNLWLSGNKISDISPLKGMTNLESLYVDYNNIKDIAFLNSFQSLKELSIKNNQITDFSPLGSLKKTVINK
ncbi:MAG TPA: leucine-rich repeat domain-containing protein [Clostridiaceae bacterium]